MAASAQTLKESKHRTSKSLAVSHQSELSLNRAFDGLNRCELRTRAVPSELGNIIQKSIDSAVQVYTQANMLHRAGQYSLAKKNADAVCRFCNLMNNLAEEQTDNVLHLQMPPQMHAGRSKKTARTRHLHPSLNLLDSMIRSRMTHLSHFYRSRLSDYPEVLLQFSKFLEQVEKVH